MTTIDADLVKGLLPKRPADSHKGNFGKLLCICGSEEMPGAAVLSVKAALRCGVGLCIYAGSRENVNLVAGSCPEAVFCTLTDRSDREKLDRCIEESTAVLLGPGLSQTAEAEQLVSHVVLTSKKTLVIDADGINSIAKNINILKKASCPVIVTPHPGEMSRLKGLSVTEIQRDRETIAAEFSKRFGVTVVLKGAGTIVAGVGSTYGNQTGNPGLSKGGSGDVLAGMIASLAAQGVSPVSSAVCGVFLHGFAADLCAARKSVAAMLPTDLIETLPEAFLKMEL